MSDPNPSERLAEIEARVEAVTAGPWLVARDDESGASWIAWERPDTGQLHTILDEVVPPVPGDARFIAHAREDIPWLLEQVREAREAGDKLFEAMPKKSSIWDTFREENIDAMREALQAWEALADSGEAGGEAG